MLRRPPRSTLFPTRRSSDLVQPTIVLFGNTSPRTEMDFVNGNRGLEPILAGALREPVGIVPRSEEHTSELQSRVDLVCRLLLEKKKKSTPKSNPDTRKTSTR